MRCAFMIVALLISGSALADYHFDLGRLFPSDIAEEMQRDALVSRVDEFNSQPAPDPLVAARVVAWLEGYESLLEELQKHETYVYLKSEMDHDDSTDSHADAQIGDVIARLKGSVEHTVGNWDSSARQKLTESDGEVGRYAHFINSTTSRGMPEHVAEAVRLLADPAIASLGESYVTLRRKLMRTIPPGQSQDSAEERFTARFQPFEARQDDFAALLLPIVTVGNGKAKLQGFASAPEAAYARAGLPVAAVSDALTTLRRTGAYERYVSIIAGTAANRLHIPTNEVRAWTLESADEYQPPPVEFPAALQSILRAERRLGGEIASQYQRLFDPAAGRVEWCRDESCDDSGFSVGFAGMTSGLFYGAFRGTTDNVRALAHEAGHAVHRQLLNENQPLAIYNTGPSFMFESFAIFSDLLALDHLYRTGRSPAEQAYYLHQFLEDAIHNVYGSAVEVDLETSMYAGAQAGTLRRATDLDKLSLEVISRYIPVPARDPRMQVLWARNRLYFTDPLYDVNYLFAGLLALEYLHRLESDVGFQRGYVALLKNGFTDTSEHLTEGYLKIDLSNTALLAQNAAALIESRAKDLGILYARVESARRNSRK